MSIKLPCGHFVEGADEVAHIVRKDKVIDGGGEALHYAHVCEACATELGKQGQLFYTKRAELDWWEEQSQ